MELVIESDAIIDQVALYPEVDANDHAEPAVRSVVPTAPPVAEDEVTHGDEVLFVILLSE